MNIIITKGQKKILLYAIIGIMVIFLFWLSVYLPSRKQMEKFQSELTELEKQLNKVKMIEEIREAISKGYTYTQSIEKLKGGLATLSRSIAAEEGAPLQYISSSARRLDLEILSIKPAAKTPLLNRDKKQIKIAGANCFQLPVSLKLKGGYKSIGSYIKELWKKAPSLIAIENFAINKTGNENILLADIDLTIYLRGSVE